MENPDAPRWPRTRDRLLDGVGRYLSRYHRHTVIFDSAIPTTPALIVSNHGFGGAVDLNVLALATTLEGRGVRRDITYLTHQATWTVGLGPVAESIGCQVASWESAREAFAAGRHVAVFPGGDIEAAKPWRDRHRVVFAGRSGFARLAIDQCVPVVPIVTSGAGNSAFVISDGQALARALGLPKLARLKALPVSVSIPWGLSVGLAGSLPYLPLPVRITTAVLPPMWPEAGELPVEFARRVEQAMQHRLEELVAQ